MKPKMKKVITYGTYDLLHQGHINLLRRAKELGDWLIVGVTNDSFDRERGKLNVRNNVIERVEAVKATGFVDQVRELFEDDEIHLTSETRRVWAANWILPMLEQVGAPQE